MIQPLDAFLRSWPFHPWLVLCLAVTAWVYLRGWIVLRRRDPQRWHFGMLMSFIGGLAVLFIALASPIEPFASLLLQFHMLQHLLLMMVAPPLIWLAAPFFPLLRGLPRQVRTHWVTPFLQSSGLRAIFARLTHPAVALVLFIIATWVWHTPAAYELSLRSGSWHYVQHICFLGTALLFWFPVIQPYPAHITWSSWLLIPYLVIADVQNTVLAAMLTFSNQVLYPHYARVPRVAGISALDDQSIAGVLMWVPGSMAFLIPLFSIGLRLLFGAEAKPRTARSYPTQPIHGPAAAAKPETDFRRPLPLISPSFRTSDELSRPARFDLLRVPLLGRFLRWRHARLAMQIPMMAFAAILILDGLRGPQIGSMNLAGVVPWIHWRGLLILSLLVAGNVFCMTCPFVLPRTFARRWLPEGRNWPLWLQNKWLAVILLVLFLWSYEAFHLWDSPWWTAWIVISYFVLSFVIDSLFRGAAFCKYVCPIGQFNFVQSLASPLEVRVIREDVCAGCQTRECIRGTSEISGCELQLFQPRKSGNMDCTFCLDCAHACPHENVGILSRLPASELWHDKARSGVGRFSQRHDLAVLVVILVFGAFANAAGMVSPVLEWRNALASQLGPSIQRVTITVFYVIALLVIPVLSIGATTLLSRWWGRLTGGVGEIATRYSYALAPIGFGMWLSHYSFHFVTSYDTIVPVTVRFIRDLGFNMLGRPHWVAGCCRVAPDGLLRLEILFLELGMLLSLYTNYRIALNEASGKTIAYRAFAPWAILIGLMFATGIWILFQPMQMRGAVGA